MRLDIERLSVELLSLIILLHVLLQKICQIIHRRLWKSTRLVSNGMHYCPCERAHACESLHAISRKPCRIGRSASSDSDKQQIDMQVASIPHVWR